MSNQSGATRVRVLNARLRPLTLALHLAFAAALAGAGGQAMAQTLAQAEPRIHYDVPAGPLADALNRYAQQSGVALAVDAAPLRGMATPGLKGSYEIGQGFAVLLRGSGYSVAKTSAGYVLQAATPAGSSAGASAAAATEDGKTMDVVNIIGERNATTEGTGSYTTGRSETATRMGLSVRETPQSVSVITRQRIEDQGLTNLTDVLAQTPGLVLTQGGNAGSDSSPVYSRGFAVETYMIDGVRQVDSNYSDVFQTNDMALYDRVEVVRGATGMINGVGTPSAAINMVRKRPTSQFQASAKLELGEWKHRRIEGDISAPLNQAGTLRGRLVAAKQKNQSYIDRLEEDKDILYAVVEADLAPGTLLRGGISYQKQDATGHARGGLPAYFSDGTLTNWARSDSAAPSWSYSKRSNTTYFTALEQRFNNGWQLTASLSRANGKYDELVGYASGGNPVRATGAGVNLWAGRWAAKPQQDTLDLYARGKFTVFGRQHDMVLGLLDSRTDYDTPSYTNWRFANWSSSIANIYTWDGTSPAAPDNPSVGRNGADERLKSAYASVRLRPTDNLSVLLGARVTDWSRSTFNLDYASGVRDTTEREETGQVTPYAGLVYNLSDNWSAYGSYTSIFKPQSNRQANGDYIDPQEGASYELGLKGAFYNDRLNLSAAVYKSKQDNLAIAIPDVFAPDGSAAYEAVSGTSTRGFEAEISGELATGWQLSGGFAHNMTEDRDGARLNTQVPKNTATVFSTYRLAGVGNGLTLGGGLRWQSKIYTDDSGPLGVRYTQDSYSVVDLMARYPIDKTFTVAANLGNAFDKSYHGSTGNSYYGAPRQFRLTLDARF